MKLSTEASWIARIGGLLGVHFVGHAEARMEERGLSEVEVRTMLHDASELAPSRQAGRWLLFSALRGRRWTVVVEPDADNQIIYVVTAYEAG